MGRTPCERQLFYRIVTKATNVPSVAEYQASTIWGVLPQKSAKLGSVVTFHRLEIEVTSPRHSLQRVIKKSLPSISHPAVTTCTFLSITTASSVHKRVPPMTMHLERRADRA